MELFDSYVNVRALKLFQSVKGWEEAIFSRHLVLKFSVLLKSELLQHIRAIARLLLFKVDHKKLIESSLLEFLMAITANVALKGGRGERIAKECLQFASSLTGFEEAFAHRESAMLFNNDSLLKTLISLSTSHALKIASVGKLARTILFKYNARYYPDMIKLVRGFCYRSQSNPKRSF